MPLNLLTKGCSFLRAFFGVFFELESRHQLLLRAHQGCSCSTPRLSHFFLGPCVPPPSSNPTVLLFFFVVFGVFPRGLT